MRTKYLTSVYILIIFLFVSIAWKKTSFLGRPQKFDEIFHLILTYGYNIYNQTYVTFSPSPSCDRKCIVKEYSIKVGIIKILKVKNTKEISQNSSAHSLL